eukprot:comp21738_c2_seq1/m.30759 comp21738_c2_seq1/g.30759  ORF comp21738_c2_seq1/g.30759 comp21738_c2_seq1/m.30759 type:complete len:252 (-) comp21738_c2_seq1:137-892(-)
MADYVNKDQISLDNDGEDVQEQQSAPGKAKTVGRSAKEERLRKLQDLKLRRNEASNLNRREVIEEDKRAKLPKNWEAKKRRVEWELSDEEARKAAEAQGLDYDRLKALNVSAVDAERIDEKNRKKNPDTGFADFKQAQYRQYKRLTKSMQPDSESYQKSKEKWGDDFYAEADSLTHGLFEEVPEENVDRLVNDLHKQIEKREKFSRRRAFHEDADIDYINDRNARFNKKAERFFGQHTTEIKQSLERGTAL